MLAMNPQLLLILLGGLSAMLLLAGITFALGPNPNKNMQARLERLRDKHLNTNAALARAQMRKLLAQRPQENSALSGLIPRKAELAARLVRTGLTVSLGKYAQICAGITLVMTGVFAFILKLPIFLALLLGILVGIGLPHMVTGMMISGRIAKFIKMFPDAIDLLVRGLRAGLPISEAIGIAGREMLDPIGIEFRAVADKIRIGKTLDQALGETARSINVPEFQFFVIALAIQRETGGNLAETLNNLSEVLRKRMQMKLKIAAMSSEAKASAYIVGCLPFVVFALISFMNPEYVAPFTTDTRLMIAGGVGMLWMSIGAFMMYKMVNFEI